MSETNPQLPGPSPQPVVGDQTMRRGVWLVVAAAAMVLLLWFFPSFWYTHADASQGYSWLVPRQSIAGWQYKELPVSKSAERQLVADETFSGAFTAKEEPAPVHVFLANRYSEKPNDIGLFVHTPDRCWTESGWVIQPIAPDYVQLRVHGIPMMFERRLFVGGEHQELVYFGGLVGGQPVPYRMDYNLSVGVKVALQKLGRSGGAQFRAVDTRFWGRIWDSFLSRRQLFGPKQFIRISTPVEGDGLPAADHRLVVMLDQWLEVANYEQELQRWQSKPKKAAEATPE